MFIITQGFKSNKFITQGYTPLISSTPYNLNFRMENDTMNFLLEPDTLQTRSEIDTMNFDLWEDETV